MNSETFYSHGKLLLCGEYAVLDGATAFALPTKKGQSLQVELITNDGSGTVEWQSIDVQHKLWFRATLKLPYFVIHDTSDEAIAVRLVRFLMNAKVLNPQFLDSSCDYRVTSQLEFELDEGLGSSSTLTNNIALWAKVNPYALHFNAFKGSGYDVAVAREGKPLLYKMNGAEPEVEIVPCNWDFKDKLYFVHLNRKQDSRKQIARYRHQITQVQIDQVSRISRLLAINNDYFEFCLLLELLENEMSQVLGMPTVKQELFSDFQGSIKSLGAWGGDYILATGSDIETYFKLRGYTRIIPFNDMIRHNELQAYNSSN